MLPGLQRTIAMEPLPDDISQLAEKLLHSELLADFQVKMVREWHDQSIAQRNHMRQMQTVHFSNIHTNLLESDEFLWDHPDSADLIREEGMAQMVSPC